MTTSRAGGARRPRGAGDPGRRDRIARAAIAVVAERGVEGLTHRAVAAAAGVPLGSTTYHFETLDDLLEMALETAAADNTRRMRDWAVRLPAGADLAGALAGLAVASLAGEDRANAIVEYELYVAALHRPRLRAASAAWDAELAELFAARTDPLTGRLLAATFCGLVMQGLVADPPPERDGTEALFRRALGEPVKQAHSG